jgi:uncharacterized protein YcgI (DUF1989 family)
MSMEHSRATHHHVMLRAEMDLIAAFWAGPQDTLPINGRAGQPAEAHFGVSDRRAIMS